MRQGEKEAMQAVGAEAMIGFTDWLIAQDTATSLRGLAYASVIFEVIEGTRTVQLRGLAVPDFWSMELALVALRAMAREQGFLDAAAFCDETLQDAQHGAMGVAAFVEMLQA